MKRIALLLTCIVYSLCIPVISAAAQDVTDGYVALREQDLRLARIAERLQQANVHMCNAKMPITGLLLHTRDQYTDPRPRWFANGDIAVADVVPGSPADMAGVRANDALLAIGQVDTETLQTVGEQPLRDTVFALLADQTADAPVALGLQRGEEAINLAISPRPGCRVLVEILAQDSIRALSDGRVLQVTYGLAVRSSDDELAVVVAHELAHVVMEHRRRLEAAGVSKGLLGEFGRNQRLNRQVEVEADRLSVHLMANAGYDPQIAPAFWHSDAGKSAGSGILRSAAYPSPTQRGEMLAVEIARYLRLGSGTSMPGHLLYLRDIPF